MIKPGQLFRLVLGISLMVYLLPCSARGQKKPGNPVSSLCGRDSAVQIVQEQIAPTKTFADPVKRIRVLTRAANLLWPHENAKARSVFVEAFDLATQDHKEKGDGTRREGIGLVFQIPDQRYAVISAIGKRDLAWPRKLSDQMLDDEAREAKEEKPSDPEGSRRTNEKLLTIASGVLPIDQAGALNFARSSLRYSASLSLPLFLFKLETHSEGRCSPLSPRKHRTFTVRPSNSKGASHCACRRTPKSFSAPVRLCFRPRSGTQHLSQSADDGGGKARLRGTFAGAL